MWMPSATPGSASRDDREGRADLRRQRAAVGVAQHDALGARVGGGAQAVERVAGVEGEAVEEVLGVEQHALARAQRGTRPSRRSSRGSPRARRARPSRRAAPRPCRRACRPARSTRRGCAGPRRASARDVAAAGHPEGDDLGARPAARRRAARTAPAPSGSTPGSPPRSGATPSSSRACTTRTFSCGGEGHAAAAHAVAQGGVVQLYVGHGPSPRRSSARRAPRPRPWASPGRARARRRATRGSARCARGWRRRRPPAARA